VSQDSFPTRPTNAPDVTPAEPAQEETQRTTVQTDSSLPQDMLDRIFHEAHDHDADFLYISRKNPLRKRLVMIVEDYDTTQIVRIMTDVSD
jgi:hypothetical protein